MPEYNNPPLTYRKAKRKTLDDYPVNEVYMQMQKHQNAGNHVMVEHLRQYLKKRIIKEHGISNSPLSKAIESQ